MSAEALARFLPRAVVAHLAPLASAPTEPCEQIAPAAVMLADVSGFTALAERLARQGPAGAEQLTRTLNAFFDALIERIHTSGGDVLKFAGDALVVAWPGEDGEAEAVQRAAACGLALQAYAEDAARGPERLRLKVAVGSGALRVQHIGGWGGRWEVLITGDGLSSLAAITPLGKPGQVLLTADAHRALGGQATVTALSEAAFLLERVDAAVGAPALAAPALPPSEWMAGYVPEAVTAGGLENEDHWLSELRPVSVMFINFPNATFRTPLERAHGIMRLLQQTVDRYEGTANKISVDEKGVSVVAVFGTPPHAHADDPARAVLAARALQPQLAAHQVVHAIGIASGMAFCGVVGGTRRREYTVLGDTVNLAARLMQAAKNDLLCDGQTAQRASARVHFEALPALTVKGKAEPVPVFRPGDELMAGAHELAPLLGRAAELSVLHEVLAAAKRGAGTRPLLIEGEAGLGKSRLMVEAERLGEELELPCLRGAADPLERDTPYFAWRAILERILGLDAEGAARGAQAQAWLDAHGVAELAPLLNPLLGLELPETPATLELAGPVRGENTRELLIRILEARSRLGVAAVLLEDAHWLDGASWSLAVLARHRAPNLLLVLTSRPPEPPESVERRTLLAEARRLALGALDPDEAVALACQRLQVRALPEGAARLVRERGGGHPYFSEELAYALRDSGLLRFAAGEATLAEGRAVEALQLPASIQGVIAQRVDRLPAELKITLKAASVIGRTFGMRLLQAVHPARLEQGELARHLAELARLDLTSLEAHGAEQTHAFKHALTREAVYGTVLTATRRELHAAVATWYEREHAHALAAHAAVLAHHWIQAEDIDRGRACLELAGEQALGSGAPREAVVFLQDAIAREKPAADAPLARAKRRRLWGESLLDCGRLNEARQALEAAVEVLGWPMPRAKPRWALALLGHALRQVGHRLGSVDAVAPAGRELEAEGARIHGKLALVCIFQNQPEGTLFSTLASLNLAESSLVQRDRVRAYADLAVGCSLLPAPGLARTYERLARVALSERPRLADEGWARMVLSMVHVAQGSWQSARDDLLRACEIQLRLGDHRRLGEARMILAMLLWLTGDLPGAQALSEEVLAVAQRTSDVHMQSGSNAHVAYGLLRLGELARARQHLEDGARCADEAAAIPEQVYTRGLLALTRVLEGRHPEAGAELDRVVALLPGLLPTAVYAIEGYGAVVAAALRLRDADPRGAARLKGAMRGLEAYARTFPIAAPRLLRYQGKAAEAIARARELGLPVDVALGSARLGLPEASAELSRVGTPFEQQQAQRGEPLALA